MLCRGGAGISKVVRPLLVESKCVGADAVRSGRAGLLIRRHKSGNDNEKREHKASLRVVLRLSLQSEDETNDPLKSGPALARPAGPPTPPLLKS